MQPIRRMTGAYDVADAEYRRLYRVRESLQSFLWLHGYRYLDTPVLEETDLFLRKSGGELAARMYSLVDSGGRRLSLRPDFTSSVIRAYLERRDVTPLPLRVQYAGPVFRHDADSQSAYRQFIQVGAELLGAGSVRADAEIISLVCRAAARTGLRGATLVMGNVGAVSELLEGFQLSERARSFLVSRMGVLRSGQEGRERALAEAEELGLLRGGGAPGSGALLSGLLSEERDGLAQALLHDASTALLGARAPEEVLDRFVRKLAGADEPHRVREGLAFAERLAQVRGEPREALKQAEALARASGLDPAPIEPCRRAVEALDAHDLDGFPVVFDFSKVRSLAYYTGAVFDLEHPETPPGMSLCGGGRYDGLVRALGGEEDVPALGFAFALEPLAQVIGDGSEDSGGERKGVLVMAAGDAAVRLTLEHAHRLRDEGVPAEVDANGRSLEENLAYARRRGLSAVVAVESNGERSEHPIDA